MLEICPIASGSNGNCYYIGNEQDAVLVDAGISTKQILNRMKLRNLNPSKLKAIFISHEHSDHISGARVLEKRLNIPVFMTTRTWYGAYKNQRPNHPRFFTPGDKIMIGEFKIHTFLKNHDATEPCSFRIEYQKKSIGVFTDIGNPCKNVTYHLKKCHGLFLETNYDEKMLWEGRYPWYLKKRVASDVGHLSNKQAFDLLTTHGGKNLKCVFLSHISKENNSPEIAIQSMRELTSKFDIRITSRYEAGEVYQF